MIDFFNKNVWSLKSLTPPWGRLKSVYDQVRRGAEKLPDDDIVFEPNKLRWVGGLMEGAFGSQMTGNEKEKRTFALVSALQYLLQHADDKSLRTAYDIVIEKPIVDYVDEVIEQLRNSVGRQDESRLFEVGRYFVTGSGHREAVKFGLALIGVFGNEDDAEILRTLGKCDEFTLFAAIALARVSAEPEQALWDLAKDVHGWGRIQIVRRLAETRNPDIQEWMLRDGFRNQIMDEYLACICARAGRLHEALNGQFVDDALLGGAADIIHALIRGGPAEGIDDYEYSADACESYVNIVWSRPDLGLQHFLSIAAVRDFLQRAGGWEKRQQYGWNESRRSVVQSLANEIFARTTWRSQMSDALESENDQVFRLGDEVSQVLSVDTWDRHFLRVRADPLTSSSWYRLMQQTDEGRIDLVLAFAESVLPFDQIETGPDDQLGLGPEFHPHQALDWVLQDLARFPGRGWRLIRAGLRSPVVRNRNMAINALTSWDRNSWGPEIQTTISNARDVEPAADVKKRLESLLAGKLNS
jgi:hypothetical protein